MEPTTEQMIVELAMNVSCVSSFTMRLVEKLDDKQFESIRGMFSGIEASDYENLKKPGSYLNAYLDWCASMRDANKSKG